MSGTVITNSSIPADTSNELRPGLRYKEKDWHGGQAPGKRGFDANFPYPLKGDRGEDSMPARQPPGGGGPFKNLRKGT